ncbi:MAG: DUF4240 domain-containing protein [Hyphomicrobiaceae bacterium]
MTYTAMDLDRFWSLVGASLAADDGEYGQLEALQSALRELSLEEIVGFEMTFRRLLNEAYTWDLWGAAYVANGGCSDDGFEYFRRWLISRGRAVYEAALADPDSLGAMDPGVGPDGIWENEEIYDAAGNVYAEKGGAGEVAEHADIEAGLDGLEPDGTPFEEEGDDLEKRFPKLWKRFGDAPLG